MIAPDTLLQNRYLVQQQIGQGGMGAVYLATDQRFGSTVALKETFFSDPGLRRAFEREARLLNHLRHSALPRVSDHFTEGDGQFLVMEFIPGADLSATLKEKNGPFPLPAVLDWADQLLDALEYLHTHEPPVIHRDIKPQNLKLTARGHVVLLDFGLAKGTPVQASRVTQTGSLFGYSFNYAPLEQMQGTGTDPRSDLYSLGATLYHLMTGTPPPDALTRATAVLNGEADPLRPASEVHPQVTPAVARVLTTAMAQSAAQRPQTAAAMRELMRQAAKPANTANAPTVVQSVAGTSLHEQDTQLIGAPAETSSAAATNVKEAGATAGLHEAATIIQATPVAGAPATETEHHQSAESVVTELKPAQPQRRPLTRALSVLASVLLLAVIAAGAVYIFKRQAASPTPKVETPPTAGETAPSEPVAPVEAQQKTAPSPEASATPATAPQAATLAPGKAPKRKPDPTRANAPAQQNDRGSAVPEPQTPETPKRPDDNRQFGLSPEERAKIAEEIRRAKRERHEAEMKRREALRVLRQQQRQQPQQTPYYPRRVPPPPPQGSPSP